MTKRLIEDSSLLAHKLSKIVFNGPGFLLHFTLYEFLHFVESSRSARRGSKTKKIAWALIIGSFHHIRATH